MRPLGANYDKQRRDLREAVTGRQLAATRRWQEAGTRASAAKRRRSDPFAERRDVIARYDRAIADVLADKRVDVADRNRRAEELERGRRADLERLEPQVRRAMDPEDELESLIGDAIDEGDEELAARLRRELAARRAVRARDSAERQRAAFDRSRAAAGFS